MSLPCVRFVELLTICITQALLSTSNLFYHGLTSTVGDCYAAPQFLLETNAIFLHQTSDLWINRACAVTLVTVILCGLEGDPGEEKIAAVDTVTMKGDTAGQHTLHLSTCGKPDSFFMGATISTMTGRTVLSLSKHQLAVS